MHIVFIYQNNYNICNKNTEKMYTCTGWCIDEDDVWIVTMRVCTTEKRNKTCPCFNNMLPNKVRLKQTHI